MSIMYFDTLKFVERLKAGGVPEAQAKAEAEALTEVLDVNLKELATKGDLAAVKSELAAVKAELKADIADLRKDVDYKLSLLEQRMVIKLGALMVAAVGAAAALAKLL